MLSLEDSLTDVSSICCRFFGVINDDCVDGRLGLFESQAKHLLQRGEDCGAGLIGGQRDIYFRGISGVNCGVALPLHFEIVDAVKSGPVFDGEDQQTREQFGEVAHLRVGCGETAQARRATAAQIRAHAWVCGG